MSESIRHVMLKNFVPAALLPVQWADVAVKRLTVDSRTVGEGDCFIAYPGHVMDGRKFIADALQKGAAAVIAEADGLQLDSTLPVIAVPALKTRLGELASRFYGDPSARVKLVAVTGTNGKTTVTHLIAQAVDQLQQRGGVIGTLGNGLVAHLEPTQNTTPDIIAINAALHAMAEQNVRVVAMEASSHGLVQGRLDGLTIQVGIITNLSRDHLDYHGSMEAYRDAKALLAQHPSLRYLVLNADDETIASMASLAHSAATVTTFSTHADMSATVKINSIEYGMHGLTMSVAVGDQVASVRSALIGEFNAANVLAALACLLVLDVDLVSACAALEKCRPVPGRMEIVNPHAADNDPVVVVDFAHTPDALEKVLIALRRHCQGQLWCVFGCGGDRDAGKRPLMGAAVARFADNVVITSDNPRSEKPAKIIADIVKGIPPGQAFELIEDRVSAIEYAVLNAASHDLILLAGKGHEEYQEIQGVKHPYSDMAVANSAIVKRHQKQQSLNG